MSVNPSPHPAGSAPASGDAAPSTVKHRPAWIAFVVLGSIFCLAMGYWQLSRYQEATGTVQNLGYTFMWPFLAGFLIYAYIKYIRLEADEADLKAGAAATPAGVADAGAASAEPGSGASGQTVSGQRGSDEAGPGRDAAGPGDVGRADVMESDDDTTVQPVRRASAARSRTESIIRGRPRGPVVTEIPADLLPTRRPARDTGAHDEGLAAYNSYLAELARQDGLTDHSQERPAS